LQRAGPELIHQKEQNMALSDSITERRQAFTAGLAIIEPQIKGVRNKLNDDISSQLKRALNERLTFLLDRQTKIKASQATQDAADAAGVVLEEDGFPEVPVMEIPEALALELQQEGVADDAAAAGFEAIPRASNVNISLGVPADKP
jgi:hypothetical protein